MNVLLLAAIVIQAEGVSASDIVEVLVRRDGDWRVVQRSSPVVAALPAESRVALRVRDASREQFYWWAEVDGTRAITSIRMERYKSLAIGAANAKNTIAIVTPSDDEPRVVAPGKIEIVAQPAIVCELRGIDAACQRVEATAVVVRLADLEASPARLLRLPPESVIEAKREGVSFIRPRPVRVTEVAVDRWRVVSLTNAAWTDVLLDVASPSTAIQRIAGDAVPLLPDFTTIVSDSNHGFAVRAIAQSDKTVIVDTESILAVFPMTAGLAGRIPIARSFPDKRGEFAFPGVAAGTYRVRFVSAVYGGASAVLTFSPGQLQTLEVRAGITVTGKLILRAGGHVTGNGRVEATRVEAPDADSDLDRSDLLRAVTAADDGRFAFPVAAAGTYTLRAVWGSGRAEKQFKVSEADVNLGDIILQAAAALRGLIPQCRGGELHLVPLPDPEKKTALPFFEFVRVPVDQEGRYFAEGLREGQWIAKAKCANNSVAVEPPMIVLPATGIVVQDFTIADM